MVNPYNYVYVDCQVTSDQVPRNFIKSEVECVTVTGVTRKRKLNINPEFLQNVQNYMKSSLVSSQKERVILPPKRCKSLEPGEIDDEDDDTDLASLRKRLLDQINKKKDQKLIDMKTEKTS